MFEVGSQLLRDRREVSDELSRQRLDADDLSERDRASRSAWLAHMRCPVVAWPPRPEGVCTSYPLSVLDPPDAPVYRYF